MTKPAAATRSIVVEREMPHPPEKIWRALTQGPLIEEWLMKNDFQPVVGHRFNFRATPMPHWNGVLDCQVLVVEPNQRLSYSLNAMTRRQFGKVITPLKVHSARLPPSFGLFYSKISKLDKKLLLPPETALLIREQVARINMSFLHRYRPMGHDQSIDE